MKTPYELESLGWKITQIDNGSVPSDGLSRHDYVIFHAFHFPYGRLSTNTRLKEILEFIDNFIKEDQHKEGIERFNLDR